MELGKLIVKIGADVSELQRNVGQVSNVIKTEMQKAEQGSKILLGGLSAVGAGLVAFGVNAVKSAGQMETVSTAFRVMIGDAEKAKTLMADLQKFGAETPFEFPEIQQAAKSLLAFGVGADDVVKKLREIGDISSAVGAPLNEIAEIYGKAKVQGRLFAEDVNQLTGRGIPIIQELAKQFGVSQDQVRKLVEEGKVGFPQLEQAFTNLTSNGGKFAGMMKEQSETLPGLWSNLMDSIGQSSVSLGQELIETFDLKDKLKGLIDSLNEISKLLKDKGLKGAIDELFPDNAKMKIVAIAGAIAGALVPAIASLAVSIWTAMAPLLPFMAAGAALAALAFLIYKNWKPIKDFFVDLWTGIRDKTVSTWNTIKDYVSEKVTNVVETIKSIITRIKSIPQEILKIGVNIATGLWNGLKEKSEWLKSNIIKWIKSVLPDPVEKVLGIKSPSKVFEEIGTNVVEGLVNGLINSSPQLATANQYIISQLKSLNDQIIALEKQRAAEQQAQQEANMQREIANLATEVKLQQQRIALTQKDIEIARKKGKDLSSLYQQLDQERQSLLEKEQQYADASARLAEYTRDQKINALKEEQAFLQNLQNIWNNFVSNIKSATETYQNNVNQALENEKNQIEQLTNAYENELSNRTSSLYKWVGLFDAIPEKINALKTDLMTNLKNQVKAFRDWQSNITKLANRGIEEGLIAELQAMGPQAAGYIEALNTMTDEELREYVQLWLEKNQLARSQAENELQGLYNETQQKIQQLKIDTAAKLAEYESNWRETITDIKDSTITKLTEMLDEAKPAGATLIQQIIDGIRDLKPGLQSEIDDITMMVEGLTSIMGITPSVPQWGGGWEDIGNGIRIPDLTEAQTAAYAQAVRDAIARGLPTPDINDFFNIPRMANGGIVRNPGLSLVGERGPEILNLPRGAEVLPLSAAGAGGDTYHIYITGNNISSDYDVDKIGEQLVRYLQRKGVRM